MKNDFKKVCAVSRMIRYTLLLYFQFNADVSFFVNTVNCQVKCNKMFNSWFHKSWAEWKFKTLRGHTGNISPFGIKLPKQTVTVLIRAFLPDTIWVSKVNVTIQGFLVVRVKGFEPSPINPDRNPMATTSRWQVDQPVPTISTQYNIKTWELQVLRLEKRSKKMV